jgi:DNA-binding transcriptional regulator GbsR (MarR family)
VTFGGGFDAGMQSSAGPFPDNVTTMHIHDEIEQLSETRQDLWQRLSDGLDPAVKDEIKALDERLQELWQTLRLEKARIRFGEREEIVRRARAEERLERAA